MQTSLLTSLVLVHPVGVSLMGCHGHFTVNCKDGVTGKSELQILQNTGIHDVGESGLGEHLNQAEPGQVSSRPT